MSIVEIKVPDIGGHENVDIIAVEVKVGDTIAVDDTLITLETDKATMDVPCTEAGVVKAVFVKVGDKVSEGSAIIEVETAGSAAAAPAPAASSCRTCTSRCSGSSCSRHQPLRLHLLHLQLQIERSCFVSKHMPVFRAQTGARIGCRFGSSQRYRSERPYHGRRR